MRLTMKQRQAVTAVTVQRYRQGSKKVKRQILDEFCETTGYCRGYARFVLRNHGRQVCGHIQRNQTSCAVFQFGAFGEQATRRCLQSRELSGFDGPRRAAAISRVHVDSPLA